MKKIFLFTTAFFLLINLSSCKKLFGLDPESLLTKESWKGNKYEHYMDGSLTREVPLNWVLEMDKSHRYTFYHDPEDEHGEWEYDKKHKTIIFTPDGSHLWKYDVIKLDKNSFIYERKTMSSGHEFVTRYYFIH